VWVATVFTSTGMSCSYDRYQNNPLYYIGLSQEWLKIIFQPNLVFKRRIGHYSTSHVTRNAASSEVQYGDDRHLKFLVNSPIRRKKTVVRHSGGPPYSGGRHSWVPRFRGPPIRCLPVVIQGHRATWMTKSMLLNYATDYQKSEALI